jgi:hypothetical protein
MNSEQLQPITIQFQHISKKQKIDQIEYFESLDEHEKKAVDKSTSNSITWLNIGGTYFCTRVSTLTSKSKYFQALFDREAEFDEHQNGKTKQTAIFIDRDPDLFKCILSFLRASQYIFDYPTANYHLNVRVEFLYYNISRPIRFYMYVHERSIDYHALPESLFPLLCAESSNLMFHMGDTCMYYPETSKYDYLLPNIDPKCLSVVQQIRLRGNYYLMETVITNAGYEIIQNRIDTNLYIYQKKK